MAILGLIQAASGGYGAITGFLNQRKAQKQLSRPLPSEQKVAEIAAILRDPDTNPLFKAQLAAEFESLMQPLQQNITMQKLADRRAMLRGQQPSFFSPERADENIDYLTSRAGSNIMSQARANVLRNLMAAAGEYKGIGEQERSRLQEYAQSESNRTQSGIDMFQKYENEIPSIFSVGQKTKTNQYGPTSETPVMSYNDYLRRANQMTKVY